MGGRPRGAGLTAAPGRGETGSRVGGRVGAGCPALQGDRILGPRLISAARPTQICRGRPDRSGELGAGSLDPGQAGLWTTAAAAQRLLPVPPGQLHTQLPALPRNSSPLSGSRHLHSCSTSHAHQARRGDGPVVCPPHTGEASGPHLGPMPPAAQRRHVGGRGPSPSFPHGGFRASP